MCYYKNVQNKSWQYCYHWSQKANCYRCVTKLQSITGSNLWDYFYSVSEKCPLIKPIKPCVRIPSKLQHGFEAITCKISLWILESWVLMWTSPTWPFSYLQDKQSVATIWNRAWTCLITLGGREVPAASYTHTKRKRVQTWSDIGHTQMFPCFWRSFEVITVKIYRQLSKYVILKSGNLQQNASSWIYLHRGQYSLGSCYAETWLVLAPKTRDGEDNKNKSPRQVHLNKWQWISFTCLTLFIWLYFFLSSSLEGIWCLPLPISVQRGAVGSKTLKTKYTVRIVGCVEDDEKMYIPE